MTIEINFIAQQKKKSFVSLIAVVMLVFLFACIGFLYWQHAYLNSQVGDMQVQWKKNNSSLSDRTSSHNIQRQRKELAERVEIVESSLFSPRALMEEMNGLLPESGYLSNFVYDSMEGVKLTMESDSLSGAAAFSEALTNQPYVEEASLVDVYPQKTKDGQIYQSSFRFQVDTARFKEVISGGG